MASFLQFQTFSELFGLLGRRINGLLIETEDKYGGARSPLQRTGTVEPADRKPVQ